MSPVNPTTPVSAVQPMPRILRADARSLPLAEDSVDLVVTSPPYYGLRSYQDGGQPYEGQIGAQADRVDLGQPRRPVQHRQQRPQRPRETG